MNLASGIGESVYSGSGIGSVSRNLSRRSGPTVTSRMPAVSSSPFLPSAGNAPPTGYPGLPGTEAPMSVPRPGLFPASPAKVTFLFCGAPFTKVLELCTNEDCPRSEIECSVNRTYPADSESAAALASMMRPVTSAPRSAKTCPFTTMGSSSTASKGSPECAVALERVAWR